MPIRLDQIGQNQAPAPQPTAQPAAQPQAAPAMPQLPGGIPPGLDLQSITFNGKTPSLRFATPKPPAAEKPKRAAPATLLQPIERTDQAIERLQKLVTKMQTHHLQTGPLAGRFYNNPAANAYLQTVGTQDEATFKREFQSMLNDYANAQTGAQRSFKEIQWLQTALPSLQDKPENFIANAQSALQDLQDNKARMMDYLQQAGYQPLGTRAKVGSTSSGLKYTVE